MNAEETDLCWLAGLLEGEGSFLKPMPSAPNRPVISLQMTDIDVVQKAATLLGAKMHKVAKKQKAYYKDTFMVHQRGAKAVAWMQRLKPLMGIRRQKQIENALAAYDPTAKEKCWKRRRAISDEEVMWAISAHGSLRKRARQLGVNHETLRQRILKLNRLLNSVS